MLDAMQADRRSRVPHQDAPLAFLVGQDGEGHWLAVETHGLGGGIFRSRDTAVQYARDESHRLPGAVRLVEGPIRLFAS
jgi:hypothetical protein